MTVSITRRDAPTEAWRALRVELWPDADADGADLAAWLDGTRVYLGFLAHEDGAYLGFAEASLRRDYVNGCEHSPAAFLEGLYVRPAYRRRGVARALVAAVSAWAREAGCRELASDVHPDNAQSLAAHEALGFREEERVVIFRKMLA